MAISPITATGLFSHIGTQTAQLETQAQRALTRGVDLFIEKKYDDAIKEFQRAVSLAPNSSVVIDAYKQIGRSYTQKNDSDGAIEAYKQAIKFEPNDDETRIALGNVYFFEKRYLEAQGEYSQAVRINPSASNRFSLGQGYLASGNYNEAEIQFKRAESLEPNEPGGSYGLGQLYAKQGRVSEAIKAFQSAIDLKRDFWDAYVELGYVYADAGQLDDANNMVKSIGDADTNRGATLTAYIYQKTPPKMVSVSSDGSFPTSLTRGTLVSVLGEYLANAESSQAFSIIFNFNKEMDSASVENVLNWSISRSIGTGLGDGYNFGLGIPDTEVSVPPHPMGVHYDAASYSATVWFEVRQNAGADGTIDPSHLQFSFSGKDRFNQVISSEADQYTGFFGMA